LKLPKLGVLKEVGRAVLSAAVDRRHADPGAIGNAPADPFGASMTPAQLAGEFPLLRADAIIGHDGELPRYQDFRRARPDAYAVGAPPPLVLFVSHRWATPVRPDPRAEASRALATFLRHVTEVASSASSPPEERVRLVPSLRVHGVFQAALLLGNGRGFGDDDKNAFARHCGQIRQELPPLEVGTAVLNDIAVFYDYSCIPQGVDLFDPQGAGEDSAVVATALRRMHLLIMASTVLVLRSAGDDYGSRAWCVTELALGRPDWRHLVLRTDLQGTPVTDADLLGDAAPEVNNFAFAREQMLDIDEKWRTNENGWGVLNSLRLSVYFGLPELEADRPVPVLVTPHAPQTFPGHRALLEGMMGRLGKLSDMDRALDGLPLPVDLAEVITFALEQAELTCTMPEDRVYLGLQMLYARHRGAPRFAGFYAEALRRYVDRRTTRLMRYREDRDFRRMRIWWVFADEPADSAAWQPPKWSTE
jgi:hypothetical protein